MSLHNITSAHVGTVIVFNVNHVCPITLHILSLYKSGLDRYYSVSSVNNVIIMY